MNWETSELASELTGQWDGINQENIKVSEIEVSRKDDETFHIELSFLETETSRARPDEEISSATVTGELLSSKDVHILQLDAKTYREFNRAGEEVSSNHKGYAYLRILFDESSQSIGIKEIEMDQLAATILNFDPVGDVSFPALEWGDCVHKDLDDLSYRLSGALLELEREGQVKLLQKNLEEKLRQSVVKFEAKQVNPLREIKRIHTCIAQKLPGYALGSLFERRADDFFTVDYEYRLRRI